MQAALKSLGAHVISTVIGQVTLIQFILTIAQLKSQLSRLIFLNFFLLSLCLVLSFFFCKRLKLILNDLLRETKAILEYFLSLASIFLISLSFLNVYSGVRANIYKVRLVWELEEHKGQMSLLVATHLIIFLVVHSFCPY